MDYGYDGLGARVLVDEVGGARREVVHFGDLPVFESGAGSSDRNHVFAGGLRVATVETDPATGQPVALRFPVVDPLGSTRMVLTYEAGTGYAVDYEAAWKPFGVEDVLTGDTSHKYLGKEAPGAARLYRFGARYYDPEVGRFYALDPILGALSLPQTLNRYAYAINDPLALSDPTGMEPNCAACPDEDELGRPDPVGDLLGRIA